MSKAEVMHGGSGGSAVGVHAVRTPGAGISEAPFLRYGLFMLGLLLPLVTFSRDATAAETVVAWYERITLADALVVVLSTALILSGIRVSLTVLAYFFAITISFLISIGLWDQTINSVGGYLAMTISLSYVVVGQKAGSSRQAAASLFLGVAAGVLLESVVVWVDSLLGGQLFPALGEGMVRGTFRGKNQLGNFGFTASGLLLAIGWVMVPRGRSRFIVLSCGALAVLLAFVSLRRGAILALALWLILVLLMGLLHGRVGLRTVTMISLFVLFICLALMGMLGEPERQVGYVVEGLESYSSSEGFTQSQLRSVLDRVEDWFPFGLGVSRGSTLDPFGFYEIHNGHLALLVEAGPLGLLTFYSMLFVALQRVSKFNVAGFGPGWARSGHLSITATQMFVVASIFLMYHGTLFRDRGFMLLIGVMMGLPYMVTVFSKDAELKAAGGGSAAG